MSVSSSMVHEHLAPAASPAAAAARVVADHYFAAADNAFYNPTLRMSLLEMCPQSTEVGEAAAKYAHLILTPELCRQAHDRLMNLAQSMTIDIHSGYDVASNVSDSLILERVDRVLRAIGTINTLDEAAGELLSTQCQQLQIGLDEAYQAAVPLMWIFDMIDKANMPKAIADLNKTKHVCEALHRSSQRVG